MKIEREFFLPYIAGNLGNSLAKAQELHNKLAQFAPIAKVASLVCTPNPTPPSLSVVCWWCFAVAERTPQRKKKKRRRIVPFLFFAVKTVRRIVLGHKMWILCGCQAMLCFAVFCALVSVCLAVQ